MWKQSKKCSVTWYFKKNYSAVHSFVRVLMYWEERILLNTVIHEQMSSICCYSFISYSSSIRWKRNREEEKKEPRKKIFQKEHNKQTVSCVFVCVHACMHACMYDVCFRRYSFFFVWCGMTGVYLVVLLMCLWKIQFSTHNSKQLHQSILYQDFNISYMMT